MAQNLNSKNCHIVLMIFIFKRLFLHSSDRGIYITTNKNHSETTMAAPINKVKLPQKRRSQYQSLETIGDKIVTSYPGNVKTMLYNMQNFMYTCSPS